MVKKGEEMGNEDLKEAIREEVEAVIKQERETKKKKPAIVRPPNPNIHLSKAEYVAQENKKREDALKIKEFAAGLKAGKIEAPKVEQPEAPKAETKPRGRPKVIK